VCPSLGSLLVDMNKSGNGIAIMFFDLFIIPRNISHFEE
jgi:hypothetical protein